MATFPTATISDTPSSGPSGAAAAIAASLPALASLIPGRYGGILGALGTIPSSLMSYNSAKEFTDLENANRNQAISILNDYQPRIGRPAEFNTDVRVPYVAQAVRVAKAGADSTRRAAEDARIQYGSGRYGEMAPAQLYGVVDKIRMAGEDQTQQKVSELWEEATRASIENKLSIGRAELERSSANEQLGMNRVTALLQALTSPYGVTSSQGMSSQVNDAVRWAQEVELRREEIAAQKYAARKQQQSQLLGGLLSGGMSLGGAGIIAGSSAGPYAAAGVGAGSYPSTAATIQPGASATYYSSSCPGGVCGYRR